MNFHFHSINVQIIFVEMYLINDVSRWPGSTRNSFILRNSSAWSKLENGVVCDGWLLSKKF